MKHVLLICLVLSSSACLAQPGGIVSIEERRFNPSRQSADEPISVAGTLHRLRHHAEELSPELRTAGLVTLWAEVAMNFVYFDRVPSLDWDSVYMAELPLVAVPQSNAQYYRRLQAICALLEDGGTRVVVPWELRDTLGLHPPIVTRLVEDRVFVSRVYDSDIMEEGVLPGVELLAIDGIPVMEYGARRVMPYVSASTPQGRMSRTYERALLAGSCSDSVALRFRRPDGSTFDGLFAREWSEEPLFSMERSVSADILDGNIGYLRLNTFYDDYLPGYVARQFAPLVGTDALVIDLRENEEGSVEVAYEILEMFIHRSQSICGCDTPPESLYRNASDVSLCTEREPGPGRSMIGRISYDKPVVVLISPRTCSAAENFVVAFREAGRGIVVGEASAGSTGESRYAGLPGDGLLVICSTYDRYTDETEFNGVGIIPDLPVHTSIADFRSGVDPVLRAALGCLR